MKIHRLLRAIGASSALVIAGIVGAGGVTSAAPATPGACDPNYDGCVPIADDVDCGDLAGPVNVIAYDIYELDRDGDDRACEATDDAVAGDSGGGATEVASDGGTTSEGLADTGSSTATLAGGAILVLLAGVLALMASHRRPA